MPVAFDDFKTAVLSKESMTRFRTLMKRVRRQIAEEEPSLDGGIATSDVTYLPTDLSKMLSHLLQTSLHTKVSNQLVRNIKEERGASIDEILKAQEANRPAPKVELTEGERKQIWKEKLQKLIA